LRIRRELLGDEHPDTLASIHGMAKVEWTQWDQPEEALRG